MAVIFFDDKIKEYFPEAYKQTIDQIEILHVNFLPFGIEAIYFRDDRFNHNEPVIARLQSTGKVVITKRPLQL